MKKKCSMILSLALIIGLLVVTGCNNGDEVQPDGAGDETAVSKPVIAVTIVPEQTFVEAVCGDLAEVITLVPPGNSPENYEPTPQQREKFSQTSLYFSIGVPTEEANILPDTENMKVVSLHKAVAAVYPERTFESGERDPHIWLSSKRIRVMVETIAEELGRLDPENKDTYDRNAEAYIAELDNLDQEMKSILQNVQSRKFIAFHPAFGYLADDYGLTMVALQQEGKEAGPRTLQEIIDLAKRENIKAIFYQGEIDSSQSRAFAEEIEGRMIQLDPLSADYIENMKKMAETIAEAIE